MDCFVASLLAMTLMQQVKVSDPHGEERVFAHLEP